MSDVYTILKTGKICRHVKTGKIEQERFNLKKYPFKRCFSILFSPDDDLDSFEDEILGEFFQLKNELQMEYEKIRYIEYLGEIPITTSFLSIIDKRFVFMFLILLALIYTLVELTCGTDGCAELRNLCLSDGYSF